MLSPNQNVLYDTMKHFAFKTVLAVIAALLLGGAPAARAQLQSFPGGVTLLTRQFDPAHPDQSILKPVYGDPTLLRQVVNSAWQASRASIADQIIAQMGKSDSISKGVTPYDIVCRMGEPGDLSVKPGAYPNGSSLEMQYLVRGNSIEFTTTQPTAAGKWADPRFSCDYDLGLTLSVTFGDPAVPIRVTSVKAQISNAKLDSHGLIADLVFVGNAVTKMFGSDYIKRAQNAVNGKNFDFTRQLNDGLAPFNALLGQYGAQGYSLVDSALNAANGALPGGLSPRSLPGMTPNGPQLLMYLSKDGNIPTTGRGQISGAIRWKKTIGEPIAVRQNHRPILGSLNVMHPFARGFRIRAVAQSGFAREGMFLPPMTQVGKLQSATLDQPSPGRDGTPGTGDEYVLRYTIGDLPIGIPMKVEVSLSDATWSGDIGANVSRGVGPTDWEGVITLKPGIRLSDMVTNSTSIGMHSDMSDILRSTTPAAGRTGGERSIIIIGGKTAKNRLGRIRIPGAANSGGDTVSLNPQPLPPEPNPNIALPTRGGTIKMGKLGGVRSQLGSAGIGSLFPKGSDSIGIHSGAEDLANVIANIPKPKVNNPTGILSVGDIDFEVGTFAGPR